MVSYQKKTNNIWAFIDNIDSNNADSMTYQRLLTPLPYKENGNKDKRKVSLRVLSYVENAFKCLVVESQSVWVKILV